MGKKLEKCGKLYCLDITCTKKSFHSVIKKDYLYQKNISLRYQKHISCTKKSFPHIIKNLLIPLPLSSPINIISSFLTSPKIFAKISLRRRK